MNYLREAGVRNVPLRPGGPRRDEGGLGFSASSLAFGFGFGVVHSEICLGREVFIMVRGIFKALMFGVGFGEHRKTRGLVLCIRGSRKMLSTSALPKFLDSYSLQHQ